jgi:peptide deformylase
MSDPPDTIERPDTAVLPITLYGNPILRTSCRAVTQFGPALAELVEQMFDTLYATDHGVGLSANQVGRTERLFVFDFHDGMVGHVVNPVVTAEGGDLQGGEEACLSVPGFGLATSRLSRCVVRGVDQGGAAVEYEGEGLAARCFQHELDHLNGKLYIDLHPMKVRKRIDRDIKESSWSAYQALDPRSEEYLGVAGRDPTS